MLHIPPAWVLLQGFNQEEREFEQEEPPHPHLLPSPGEQGWGWGLLCTTGSSRWHPSTRAVCPELFLGRGVSVIFALKQAAFVQHCLLHLRKITSMGIKALWTPGAFHFMRHLGRKNHILQSVPKNPLQAPQEGAGTTSVLQVLYVSRSPFDSQRG